MKKFYYFLLLFSTLLSQTIQAQTWMKGYMVNLNKDTIQGLINDKTDRDLGSELEFKEQIKDKLVQHYSTEDLLGFGFNYGRIFERIVFTDTLNDTIKVFAKRILEGRIRMFVWRKNSRTDFDVFLFNCSPERSVHLTEPIKKVISEENGVQQTIYKINHVGLLHYVKDDTSSQQGKETKIPFTERKIIQNVLQYNQVYQEQYPISIYKEKKKYFFDITVGMPFIGGPGTSFRVAFYANRFSPEKNRHLSFFAGASYRFGRSNTKVESVGQDESLNYQQQWISFIPVGLNIHTAAKVIRPYFYAGLGVSVLANSNYEMVDNGNLGTVMDFLFLPALNIGVGVKIKVGSQFIAIEITPTGNYGGVFANLGYSF